MGRRSAGRDCAENRDFGGSEVACVGILDLNNPISIGDLSPCVDIRPAWRRYSFALPFGGTGTWQNWMIRPIVWRPLCGGSPDAYYLARRSSDRMTNGRFTQLRRVVDKTSPELPVNPPSETSKGRSPFFSPLWWTPRVAWDPVSTTPDQPRPGGEDCVAPAYRGNFRLNGFRHGFI